MKRLISLSVVAALALSIAAPTFAEEQPVMVAQATQEVDEGSYGGAGISNAVFVPAKGLTCAGSGVMWFVGMLLTGGSRYKMMGEFVHDACTGQWVIKGEDMNPKKEWFLVD